MLRSPQIFVALVLALLYLASPLHAQFGSIFGGSSTAPAEVSVSDITRLKAEQAKAEKAAKEQGARKPLPSFVLVDVRSPKETAVSVIPGAIPKEQFEKNAKQFRDRTVITYCTVGYRSDKYARKLIQQGFTAKNFKGSILGWCRANQPLVTLQGEATNRVHTYSSSNKVPARYKAVW